MSECPQCLEEAVNKEGTCTECGFNAKAKTIEPVAKDVDSVDELMNKVDKVELKKKPSKEFEISVREQHLVNQIMSFKYYIDNPSAWNSFSQEGSNMLRKLLAIVEGKEGFGASNPEVAIAHDHLQPEKKVYKEGDDITLKGLLVGQPITDIDGDDFEVRILTKEHTLHVKAEGSEGSRISCNMKIPVQTVKEVELSL